MAYDNLTVAAENVTNLPIRKSQEIEQVNKHTKTVAPLGTGNERQNHLSTRSQKLPENQQRNLKPIESTNLTRMVKPRTPTHRETHEAPAGTEKTNRRVCNKNRGRTRQRERSSSSNSKRRKLPDLKRATPDLVAVMCGIEEVGGPAKAAAGDYCNPEKTEFPCVPGKGYYGRGAIQLSWNYNYGPCGRDLNEGDLLATPEKVTQDQVLAFKASFWYWTTKVRSSFKSGFGPTIKAVNSMECTGGGVPSDTAANRVKYFQDYCTKLDVLPGENLNC